MNIYKGNDPELRVKCKPVEVFNEELKETAMEMYKTMLRNNGVGLSANQVGLTERIVVMHTKKPRVLINPRIIVGRGKIITQEGCLSFPGEVCEKQRNKIVRVCYQTLDGTEKREVFKKLDAIVIQHEIDHLNGVLMND